MILMVGSGLGTNYSGTTALECKYLFVPSFNQLADPDPVPFWPRDSGWEKSGSGSGMNNPFIFPGA
jgi:hypothetical protein